MQEKFEEIIKYYLNANLPNGSVFLNKETQILNIKRMVNSHIDILAGNSSEKNKMPYYQRLSLLREILESD